jgi:hypothetical protein
MKKFWIIIGSIAAVGLIICSIGGLTGAKLSMYMDDKGWHLADGKAEIIKETFDTITELDIDTDNANIEIKTGTEYSIEATCHSGKPKVSCENGVLVFKSTGSFLNFGFHFYTDKIIITLPEKAEFSRAKIENNNGKTVIEKLNAAETSIENGNGKMELRNITAKSLSLVSRNGAIEASDIAADNLEVKNHNGKVEFENIAAETGKMEVYNGKIEGRNIIGRHSFKAHNGHVGITLLNLNDYYITASSKNGSTRIDGQNVNAYGNTAAENKLDLQVYNGSVKVSK